MNLEKKIIHFKEAVLKMQSADFEELALLAFQIQAEHNEVYRLWLNLLKKDANTVKDLTEIPFLPIEFFKTQSVKTGDFTPELTFLSSGTTQQERSKHFIADANFYRTLSKNIFEQFYGKLSEYRIFALLPSYLEQGNSSLVYMTENLMNFSKKNSTFSLNFEEAGRELENDSRQTIVIGVSYALLDFVEKFSAKNAVCIETGGMKGRRKELSKKELHEILRPAFKEVHSEYGMTELLSQAYAQNSVFFTPADSMRVFFRNLNDPFDFQQGEAAGGLNIIDLGNIQSCCFIETKDIARQHGEQFEILGRYDFADLRGCNLMMS